MSGFDVEFFRPILAGTLKTMEVQCGLKCKIQSPQKAADYKGSQDIGLAGLIGFSSRELSGTIAICFSDEVYLKIMSSMIGEPLEVLDDELRDGASELLNIIYGQAKRVLNQKGYEVEMAIPTVISGKNLKATLFSGTAKAFVFPFLMEGGSEFQLQICIKDI